MVKFNEKYLRPLYIGNILLESNVFIAPMAGYSCYPFRIMCRKLGAGLAFTEMVSVNGLKYNDSATEKLLFTDESEYPKAVQLLGSEPSAFEHICRSRYIQPFDIVDINMGCPVPNIIKSNSGCALMENPLKASEIIEACKKTGKIVSVKMRLGMNQNKINITDFAKMCEDSGADMITIHGRTRNMMYSGEPLYEYIAQAKSCVSIPVIANGGISSENDAVLMMKNTGADGIMIARYGFENPLIFPRLTGKNTSETKQSLLIGQTDLCLKYFDEFFTLKYIMKLTSYFMKKQPGTKKFKQDLYRCGNIDEIKKIIKQIFPEEETNN